MPVLDGSMIQVQFRRRSAPGARIFLADPPQVLLDGLVTDGHLARDGFHRHSGRVELESALFLMTESWPVGGVIGGEDVGKARGNPVCARRDLFDRRTGQENAAPI
jgi:hypothetical protein